VYFNSRSSKSASRLDALPFIQITGAQGFKHGALRFEQYLHTGSWFVMLFDGVNCVCMGVSDGGICLMIPPLFRYSLVSFLSSSSSILPATKWSWIAFNSPILFFSSRIQFA